MNETDPKYEAKGLNGISYNRIHALEPVADPPKSFEINQLVK